MVLCNIGQDDDTALIEMQAAVRLKPVAETYAGLARILAKLGRQPEAISALRTALTLVPKPSKEADDLNVLITECQRTLDTKGRPPSEAR